MACGCNKNKVRNAGRRPIVSPRNNISVQSGVAAGPAPIQLQALARTAPKSAGGMTQERRFLERKRRAAIARRTLGNN